MVQKIVSKEKKRKEYEKRFFILECSSNLPPDLWKRLDTSPLMMMRRNQRES